MAEWAMSFFPVAHTYRKSTRELHSLIFYCTTLLNTYQRGGQLHKSLEVADDSSYHPRPYNQGLFSPSNRVSIAPAGTASNNTS